MLFQKSVTDPMHKKTYEWKDTYKKKIKTLIMTIY